VKTVVTTSGYGRDARLAQRRGKQMSKLDELVQLLVRGDTLPERYRDHALSGDWVNYRECHIEGDWLLIYKVTENNLILVRTGTHSDLF
jgi:mRNA interferase YafQ